MYSLLFWHVFWACGGYTGMSDVGCGDTSESTQPKPKTTVVAARATCHTHSQHPQQNPPTTAHHTRRDGAVRSEDMRLIFHARCSFAFGFYEGEGSPGLRAQRGRLPLPAHISHQCFWNCASAVRSMASTAEGGDSRFMWLMITSSFAFTSLICAVVSSICFS